jgi:hypothetical protein
MKIFIIDNKYSKLEICLLHIKGVILYIPEIFIVNDKYLEAEICILYIKSITLIILLQYLF